MRSVFLMPCYNYCPIASTSERKSPQVADSSCSSGDKCDCRVSKPCCSTDGGPSSFEKNSITTHKMMTKDLKKKCPVIGDIENWPPIVDDDRSGIDHSGDLLNPSLIGESISVKLISNRTFDLRSRKFRPACWNSKVKNLEANLSVVGRNRLVCPIYWENRIWGPDRWWWICQSRFRG